jgi:hypothetical protein
MTSAEFAINVHATPGPGIDQCTVGFVVGPAERLAARAYTRPHSLVDLPAHTLVNSPMWGPDPCNILS